MQNATSFDSNFDVILWLNKFAPEDCQLCPDEICSVTYFSLLWNVFEAEVCDRGASASRFRNKANDWKNAKFLCHSDWVSYLTYFQCRYVNKGNTNCLFSKLNLRDNDDPNLVSAVLKGENTDIAEIVTAILTIVYRYKNNLFHGMKWIYNLKGQTENFNKANRILARAIEINRECNGVT